MKRKICTVLALLMALVVVALANGGNAFAPIAAAQAEQTDTQADEAALQQQYDEALELLNNKQYKEALDAFEALGDYSDSKKKAQAARYRYAETLFREEQYEQARDLFEALGSFRESRAYLYDCKMAILRRDYAHAEELMEAGDYEGALAAFEALGSFHGSPDRAKEAAELLAAEQHAQAEKDAYEQGVSLMQAGDYAAARDSFILAGDYADATEQLYAAVSLLALSEVYEKANLAFENGEYETAQMMFEVLGDFEDSKDKALRCAQAQENTPATTDSQAADFERASLLRMVGRYEEANALYEALGDYQNAAELVEDVPPTFTAKQFRDDQTSPKSDVFTAPDGTKHRYQIFKGVHTWLEAKAFCNVLGGHLATLTTAEENDFVFHFMRDSGYTTAYFGLWDEYRTGDWKWVTGEPFEYSFWNPGEPSRSGRERYGMYFYKHKDGSWNDSHFYEDAEVDPGCSYICEWDE